MRPRLIGRGFFGMGLPYTTSIRASMRPRLIGRGFVNMIFDISGWKKLQ